MNPFVLMFVTVVVGILFGKIKFGKFNFGISGALFVGLLVGWLAYTLGNSIVAEGEGADGFAAATKMLDNGIISSSFFDLFLIIFVAAVGLSAAKDMKAVVKKYGAAFIVLGLVTTLVAAGVTYGATILFSKGDAKSTPYEVAGVYTGALTSSPGLGAALETAGKKAKEITDGYDKLSAVQKQEVLDIVAASSGEELNAGDVSELTEEQAKTYVDVAEAGVGIGHAVAYPFGVLIVILGVNFLPRIFRMRLEDEIARYDREIAEARAGAGGKDVPEVKFNLLTFALTCFIGYLVGSIEIFLGPLGYFSLGSTGGILIMALILGYFGKIGPVNFRLDTKILGVLSNVGLAFFLAIVGLKYGGQVVSSLVTSGAVLVLVGALVALISLLVCFFLGRYVFKLNWLLLSGAICGAMTSTPGLGAAVDAAGNDKPAAGYGATYPFGLLFTVIFVIILHILPM
ncbi:MAG: hypothetical protein LBQ21_04230, partial [Clostridiales Family XIII bacterium]|jgi:putative transport protein|nr:hypothetical protein [Clostridiales Family XIII bacterium]